jgi:hypothetical protein
MARSGLRHLRLDVGDVPGNHQYATHLLDGIDERLRVIVPEVLLEDHRERVKSVRHLVNLSA